MAFHSIWYYTDLPKDIISTIESDLTNNFSDNFEASRLTGDRINESLRKSKNSWVPSNHWITGFIWHYVQKANRENFLYDITGVDSECMQFTRYDVGEYYGWHNDSGIANWYKPMANGNRDSDKVTQDYLRENTEIIRKLSFVMQLSDPDDYEGGNLQILDETGKSYICPRKRGTIIFFDSRSQHRVLKVTKGVRKSLVGWCVGPRWK